ncbi:MAG: hypothetical protein AMS15_00485 [Planctomycetes bacterium DG_23]|nr:MAG: hypothetical protein AMS15_00485 [Planctomycetes bacterium DG_23]
MLCPFCKADNDKVVDSRSAAGGAMIRRRRECLQCSRRYTTYEQVEEAPLKVVKKDGRREPFDRRKILAGINKACEKRPISTGIQEELVDEIEKEIFGVFDREVTSKFIGELVMKHLRNLDQVAYVRFASVYREFKDVSEFLEELQPMLKRTRARKSPRKKSGKKA